jgi:transcriptional regulator with XRE-family HTH domain
MKLRLSAPEQPTVYRPVSQVRSFRKQRKWTLKKLSKMSGVSISSIWHMEAGNSPKLANAYKVARALEATVYKLWNVPLGGQALRSAKTEALTVHELRKKHGWSLDTFSELSGVSRTTLHEVEEGRIPTLEVAFRIATLLHISVYQLWNPGVVERASSMTRVARQSRVHE